MTQAIHEPEPLKLAPAASERHPTSRESGSLNRPAPALPPGASPSRPLGHTAQRAILGGWLLAIGLLLGCATAQVDWTALIGIYTYDQAVMEMGPADKMATLSNGTRVAEWLTRRGSPGGYYRPARAYYGYYGPYAPLAFPGGLWAEPPRPDRFLRLVFDPEGRLQSWKKLVR